MKSHLNHMMLFFLVQKIFVWVFIYILTDIRIYIMIPTAGIYTESISISNGSFFKLKPLVFSWLRYEACNFFRKLYRQ